MRAKLATSGLLPMAQQLSLRMEAAAFVPFRREASLLFGVPLLVL